MKIYVLFLMTVIGLLSLPAQAQRGVRIGYIDTEYILEHIPEYQDASSQLNDKVQRWKSDIDLKLNDVAQKRKDLSNEKALLTTELYEERKEDIDFEEKEILDRQQKRFGPNGDFMIQKQQLIQPIQDQIFSAVQDIASSRQYDFIFDKSADVVMLYSAERYDISELVLRSINRTSSREQANTRAERKAAASEDVVPEYNPELEAREQAKADKLLEREKLEEQRRQEILEERAVKKQEALDRRQKIIDEREAAKEENNKGAENSENNDTLAPAEENNDASAPTEYKMGTETESEALTKEQLAEEKKEQKIKDREARAQALEERKQRIMEEREKARLEREAQENGTDNTEDNN